MEPLGELFAWAEGLRVLESYGFGILVKSFRRMNEPSGLRVHGFGDSTSVNLCGVGFRASGRN